MSCSSAARAAVRALAPSSAASSDRQAGALDRVGEHVLAVAGAEVQPAQDLGELGVQRAHVGLEHRLLAQLHDAPVDVGLGLGVGLLDPGGVDAAVLQQALERQPGDLAADAVEAREQHRARGVVDDEVDPGEGLQDADVAALASDDAALQLVGLQLDHRHGRLHRVTSRDPLHAGGEDAARPAVGVVARLLLDLADQTRAVVAHLVLELAHEDLPRLAGAEPRHSLELAYLRLLGLLEAFRVLVEVALAVLEGLLAVIDVAQAQVHRLLLGAQTLLQARQLLAAGAQVGLEVVVARPGIRIRLGGRLGRVGAAPPPRARSVSRAGEETRRSSVGRPLTRGPPGAAACGARARSARTTTAPDTAADTKAASRISMSQSPLPALRAGSRLQISSDRSHRGTTRGCYGRGRAFRGRAAVSLERALSLLSSSLFVPGSGWASLFGVGIS